MEDLVGGERPQDVDGSLAIQAFAEGRRRPVGQQMRKIGAPIALAGGFASIWLLGLAALPRTTHPWRLVPALILGLIGSAFAAGQPGAIDWIQAGVALALVMAGAAMVVRRDRH